jgi:hypothetical protein
MNQLQGSILNGHQNKVKEPLTEENQIKAQVNENSMI